MDLLAKMGLMDRMVHLASLVHLVNLGKMADQVNQAIRVTEDDRYRICVRVALFTGRV